MTTDTAPRRWPIVFTVLMGTVSVVLTTNVVNVAIPSIMADFGMSQIQAQWLSTGFLASVTATMLASARLVERLGQRRTFVLALLVFVAASLLAAASWNGPVMILARVLQGAVAGVMQPLALVVIFQVFPDDQRGKAIGLYGMGVVMAPAIGPAFGGFLIDLFGWRSVYLAALPFCLVGLLGARRHMPDRRADAPARFDWPGLVLLSAGLAALLSGISAVASDAGRALPQAGAGVILLTLFLLRQRRARHPLVALTVFRHPTFVLASLLGLIYGMGLFATTYLLPLLVQGVQGLSPTATGLVLMPAGLVLAMIFPVSGRLSDIWPAHRLIPVGLAIFAVALFGLSATGPGTGFWALAGWILIGRVGLGLTLPALNLDALRGLPDRLMQQGSGVINFARQLGGALGVNLFALLLEMRVADHLAAGGDAPFELHRFYEAGAEAARASGAALRALTRGFSDTFIVLGLLFVAALIPAVAMGVCRGKIRKDPAGVRR
ncbi:EmrB/QacA family drug resistance transporter [Salinisphaera sp. PC39]|uniref:DHA2 family efflux MFS transporter permease subunit n=1 Tax=Salinisphaera sp. PC39 TaxID=1304156 RepID=UPI0033414AFB